MNLDFLIDHLPVPSRRSQPPDFRETKSLATLSPHGQLLCELKRGSHRFTHPEEFRPFSLHLYNLKDVQTSEPL